MKLLDKLHKLRGFHEKSHPELKRKAVLVVLDGFGEAPKSNPKPEGDAIKLARTPNIDGLRDKHPWSLLQACGEDVGLLPGGMGGSEIGHTVLGLGRVIPQFALMIKHSIDDKTFFKNRALLSAFRHVKENPEKRSLHLLGMISDAGVHSDIKHLFSLLEMSKQEGLDGDNVFVHCIADGRDVKKRVVNYLAEIQDKMDEIGVGKIASVVGRYYAMDRDNNWDRTKVAYDLICCGKGEQTFNGNNGTSSLFERINAYYDSEDGMEGDYYLPPFLNDPSGTVKNGDSLIFFNYRTDRPRQLTAALEASEDFSEFELEHNNIDHGGVHFVAMGPYSTKSPVAFNLPKPENNLGDWLSKYNIKQLRTAETEKFAHVTYFFNSQRDEPTPTEDRIMIPSKKVESFAEKPEMSAAEITDVVVDAMQRDTHDVVIVNYANADLVGHSGKLQPTIEAVETLDGCIGRLAKQAETSQYVLIVTGDHGNAEDMIHPDGTEKLSHSMNPVILLVCDFSAEPVVSIETTLKDGGLADVAPTLLEIMGLPKPPEMTGKCLLEKSFQQ